MNDITQPKEILQVWTDILRKNKTKLGASGQIWNDYLLPIQLDETNGIAVFEVITAELYHDLKTESEAIAAVLEDVFKRPFQVKIQTAAEIVQLPLWPKTEKAAPNSLLRSALFGIGSSRGKRHYCERERIAAWRGFEIRYTGQRLNQNDLDVWLNAIELLREGELGQRIHFTFRGFLKDLGRSGSGQNMEWLKKTISRLTACAVEISDGEKTYGGSLIQEFGWDFRTDDFFLVLNPRISSLFAREQYTRLHWETRLALPSGFAQWLHGYVCSHRATPEAPHKVRLETLYKLSGSAQKELRFFRRTVRAGAEALQNAAVIANWELTAADVLIFSRT